MQINYRYILRAPSEPTLTLPSSATEGDVIKIMDYSGTGWKVKANVNAWEQGIRGGGLLSNKSRSGTSTLMENEEYDSITLDCSISPSWNITASVTKSALKIFAFQGNNYGFTSGGNTGAGEKS